MQVPASGALRSAEAVAAVNALSVKVAAPVDVGYVLEADFRPWALNYAQPNPMNTLYLTLPTEAEARIQLPGLTADMADRARLTVSRYISDNIGIAAQARGRQLEAFTQWAENCRKQKAAMPVNPWVVYQFQREASETLAGFKQKVMGQTEPALNQMATDVRRTVELVSALMNSAGSYEQKMHWYNVLLQLRDGVSLYQARVDESDRQLMEAIAAFEQENPPVARPEGKPPARRDAQSLGIAPEALQGVELAPEVAKREPAPAVIKKEESSSLGGALVLLGMAAMAIFFFLKLRRRVASGGNLSRDSSRS